MGRKVAVSTILPKCCGDGCGLTVGRLGGDLEPIGEFHIENQFWQLVVAVEASPRFLRGFDKLEDHGERGAAKHPDLFDAETVALRALSGYREGMPDAVLRKIQHE